MERLVILFLSFLFIHLNCSGQFAIKRGVLDCNNKHTQDSLIEKYIQNGAEKLPYLYNDPTWGLYFDSIITLCPNIASAYQLKAIPFIKNGDYAKAFPLEDKAVELDPKRWTGYRGFLKCIFTKDYEGAITDFQKAQQLLPNGFEMDHTYLFYEGLCNLELGNYSEAEKNLKQDISIQSGGNLENEVEVHFNTLLYVGILYYEMGDNKNAKEYLLKCLNKYKELPEANYYLALVYKRENNTGLKDKYLQIAKQTIGQYTNNEDNLYYVNYPHQITLFEIEKELTK